MDETMKQDEFDCICSGIWNSKKGEFLHSLPMSYSILFYIILYQILCDFIFWHDLSNTDVISDVFRLSKMRRAQWLKSEKFALQLSFGSLCILMLDPCVLECLWNIVSWCETSRFRVVSQVWISGVVIWPAMLPLSLARAVVSWMMDSMDCMKTNTHKKSISIEIETIWKKRHEYDTCNLETVRQLQHTTSYNQVLVKCRCRSHMEPFLRLPALCAGLSLTVLTCLIRWVSQFRLRLVSYPLYLLTTMLLVTFWETEIENDYILGNLYWSWIILLFFVQVVLTKWVVIGQYRAGAWTGYKKWEANLGQLLITPLHQCFHHEGSLPLNSWAFLRWWMVARVSGCRISDPWMVAAYDQSCIIPKIDQSLSQPSGCDRCSFLLKDFMEYIFNPVLHLLLSKLIILYFHITPESFLTAPGRSPLRFLSRTARELNRVDEITKHNLWRCVGCLLLKCIVNMLEMWQAGFFLNSSRDTVELNEAHLPERLRVVLAFAFGTSDCRILEGLRFAQVFWAQPFLDAKSASHIEVLARCDRWRCCWWRVLAEPCRLSPWRHFWDGSCAGDGLGGVAAIPRSHIARDCVMLSERCVPVLHILWVPSRICIRHSMPLRGCSMLRCCMWKGYRTSSTKAGLNSIARTILTNLRGAGSALAMVQLGIHSPELEPWKPWMAVFAVSWLRLLYSLRGETWMGPRMLPIVSAIQDTVAFLLMVMSFSISTCILQLANPKRTRPNICSHAGGEVGNLWRLRPLWRLGYN